MHACTHTHTHTQIQTQTHTSGGGESVHAGWICNIAEYKTKLADSAESP